MTTLFNVRENVFRVTRCDEFIKLKAKHREAWMSDKEMQWGLKQFGQLYVFECLKELKPLRVLEIGPGNTTFFANWCAQNNIEYWVCEDTSEWFNKNQVLQANNDRPNVHFVCGLIGQYLDALPENYFDVAFSISTAEHVPAENVFDFYNDIKRILKKDGERTIHTIDTPVPPLSKGAATL